MGATTRRGGIAAKEEEEEITPPVRPQGVDSALPKAESSEVAGLFRDLSSPSESPLSGVESAVAIATLGALLPLFERWQKLWGHNRAFGQSPPQQRHPDFF